MLNGDVLVSQQYAVQGNELVPGILILRLVRIRSGRTVNSSKRGCHGAIRLFQRGCSSISAYCHSFKSDAGGGEQSLHVG